MRRAPTPDAHSSALAPLPEVGRGRPLGCCGWQSLGLKNHLTETSIAGFTAKNKSGAAPSKASGSLPRPGHKDRRYPCPGALLPGPAAPLPSPRLATLLPAKRPQYLPRLVIFGAGLLQCDLVGPIPRPPPYNADPTLPVALSRCTLLTLSTSDRLPHGCLSLSSDRGWSCADLVTWPGPGTVNLIDAGVMEHVGPARRGAVSRSLQEERPCDGSRRPPPPGRGAGGHDGEAGSHTGKA